MSASSESTENKKGSLDIRTHPSSPHLTSGHAIELSAAFRKIFRVKAAKVLKRAIPQEG
jgi:hypothetical protein